MSNMIPYIIPIYKLASAKKSLTNGRGSWVVGTSRGSWVWVWVWVKNQLR